MKNTRKQRMNRRAWRELQRLDNALYSGAESLACGKDASRRVGSISNLSTTVDPTSNLSTVVTSDFQGYYEGIETKKYLSTSPVYLGKP